MKVVRLALFPFAILYGIVTSIRNWLYDVGVLKSYSFDIPVIAVGNLSAGGTGKTPQIEFLIRLLSPQYKVATLSRGYKRKSKGFILANEAATAELIGDEPYQYFKKFPQIQVAVDADRHHGINQLLKQAVKPQVILLDDAFQHRRVRAGYYLLLTTYDELFCEDYILPTGNLRESRRGAKRANVILVTKCPASISQVAQRTIKKKIGLDIPIFFSTIAYDDMLYSETKSMPITALKANETLVLAGIARPKPFLEYLGAQKENTMLFDDHHHFSASDIREIKMKAGNRSIVTTEKDFVRLRSRDLQEQLYYLPISSKIVYNQELFNKSILDFVQNKYS